MRQRIRIAPFFVFASLAVAAGPGGAGDPIDPLVGSYDVAGKLKAELDGEKIKESFEDVFTFNEDQTFSMPGVDGTWKWKAEQNAKVDLEKGVKQMLELTDLQGVKAKVKYFRFVKIQRSGDEISGETKGKVVLKFQGFKAGVKYWGGFSGTRQR